MPPTHIGQGNIMGKMRAAAFAVAALYTVTAAASAVRAEACYPVPSPASTETATITVFNDTSYRVAVYWADFDGVMKQYSLLEPDQKAEFQTYAGHNWLVETQSEPEADCFGPITMEAGDDCVVRVLYDGGIGVNTGGGCLFD